MDTRPDHKTTLLPDSPWEGLDRDHSPALARWMGAQWPMGSGEAAEALPDPASVSALEPVVQRLNTYLAIHSFWHAFEQAQAHPEGQVVWGSDYDILDQQDGADLSFTALSEVRLKILLQHQGNEQSLLPENEWPQRLADGLASLGLGLAHWQWKEGVAVDPKQDLARTLEQCLGKAYAVWWQHQHLTQRLSAPDQRLSRPRF